MASFFSSPLLRPCLRTCSAVLSGVGAYAFATTQPKSRLDELKNTPAGSDTAEEQIKERKRREIIEAAEGFCAFADSCPSVYHAVDTVKKHLLQRDFIEIQEKDAWTDVIEPGGRYFLTRSGSSGSSLIAFAVGKLWEPGNPFAMIATHIDSPCLKLKPLSDRSAWGYKQVGVETYGGGLWHTWFDRDLGVAGRAFVRTSPTTIESQIVRIDEPILRVPTVATHLERQNPFSFSVETQLLPLAGQSAAEKSSQKPDESTVEDSEQLYGPFRYGMSVASNRHNSLLVEKLAETLKVHPKNIMDFDLSLYDIQKASIGGLNDEFIFSARIDNLMMSYCALNGFTNSLEKSSLDDETSVRMLVMFDHEEIGSVGPIGAQSSFLPSTLQRISAIRPQSTTPVTDELKSRDYTTAYEQAIARSFMISSDVIHGQHPNYSGYHESNHRPQLNGGIVFSSTSRRFLAKNTPGVVMLLELICKLPPEEEPPVSQFWVAVNGGDCGSTVGPHLESRLGTRTIDMGNAALSMHSIREMAGRNDVANAIQFLQLYYQNYSYFEDWVTTK